MPWIKIGQGSQFKAYDMENGRVLKIPLTEAESYLAARNRLGLPAKTLEQQAELDVRVQTLMNGKARVPSMITHPFTHQSEFLGLMGNPLLVDTGTLLPDDTPLKRWSGARFIYTQDLAEMTGTLLDALSAKPQLTKDEEQRVIQIIKAYISMVHSLWEFGYSDYVFKIGDTGFDKNGRMISIDLGEMTSDYDFLVHALGERRWRHSTNPLKKDFPQIPASLRETYTKLMEDGLSADQLKKHWRKRHVCSQCGEHESLKDFVTAKVNEIDFIDRW